MAGIGFELQKALDRKTYTSYLQAYLTAMAYSSGPWISTLVGLLLITAGTRHRLGVDRVNQFTSILVYIYALSLLTSGPIQLSLTRYVADRLFEEDRDGVLAGVLHSLLLSGTFAGVAWVAFGLWAGLSSDLLMASTFLCVIVTCVWIVMAYITSLKRYRSIVTIFGLGTALSVVLAVGLGRDAGLGVTGLLLGFGLGHAAILAGMASITTQEYNYEPRSLWQFLKHMAEVRGLVLVGLLMNTALWVDKFLVWFLVGESILPGFKAAWQYDIPAYLAYLSVLPSQALFLIKVETRFDTKYQRFLRAILESPGEVVVRRKREMSLALREGLSQLFKFQGVITLVLILLVPDLMKSLKLHALDVKLVRGMMVGAYCHFGLLHVLVFMMYLDRRRDMIQILAMFLFLVFGGTLGALLYSPDNTSLWCLGYVVASATCLAYAIYKVLWLSDRMVYLILFKQSLRDAEQRVIGFRRSTDAMIE